MVIHELLPIYNFRNPVVTIGAFDGVHNGHQRVLSSVCKKAKELNGESVVITLWPHPRMILTPEDKSFKLLNSFEEKIKLLESLCIDHLIIIPFSKELAALSSIEFIEDILVKRIQTKYLLMGLNNNIGRNREGNFETINALSSKYDFKVDTFDAFFANNKKVSSTLIRNYIIEGNVKEASVCLGYNYSLTGKVIEGNKLGRTIGFPTANISPDVDYKLIPKDGVYAVTVLANKKAYKGMLNIGIRPTLGSDDLKKQIEVHLIDFNDNLYNTEITISFVDRIRDEKKFDGIESLKMQLKKDREIIIEILK